MQNGREEGAWLVAGRFVLDLLLKEGNGVAT